MRRFLAISLLSIVTSASAQVSWSTDQFTVSSPVFAVVDIIGGTVYMEDDLTGAVSNPASGSSFPPVDLDFLFQAQPGYRLEGEQISFSVKMAVDSYTLPADTLVPAFGSFTVDINGLYTMTRSTSGGTTLDAGSYFLQSPQLSAQIDETVDEGAACPAGLEGDYGCDVGMDLVWLQALVEPTTFDVTPILVPVPEPDAVTSCLAALGLFGAVRALRGRSA